MKSSTQNVALYQLSYSQMKTYLLAALFVVGNIALPQLCHLMPQGGLIFLPIYFFTLVAAYKYGFTVGLTTAVLSPLVNSALFSMPPAGCIANHPHQERDTCSGSCNDCQEDQQSDLTHSCNSCYRLSAHWLTCRVGND